MVTLLRCGVYYLLSTYHVYERSRNNSWTPFYTTSWASGTVNSLSGVRGVKLHDVMWITSREKCRINKCIIIKSHIATIILIIHYVARCLTTASSTRSSRVTCCFQNSVILPPETAEIRKGLLTLSLTKPRKNADANLKNEKLFT
jgi:hypothetical protein